MALCSAAVTNNANSKLCLARIYLEDTSLSSTVRMELIGRLVDEYRQGTVGSIERIRAAASVNQPHVVSDSDTTRRVLTPPLYPLSWTPSSTGGASYVDE